MMLVAVLGGVTAMITGCTKQKESAVGRDRESYTDGDSEEKKYDSPEKAGDGGKEKIPGEREDRGWQDGPRGNRPGMPDGGKMPDYPQPFEGQGGEVTYTPLSFEKDGLFSSRDTESKPDLSGAVYVQAKDSEIRTIDSAGTYVLSGSAKDFTVIVDAAPEDKVQIVLDGAVIRNSDFPVIYAKEADKCFVTLFGENALSVAGTFRSDGEVNTDAVIFARCDLTLNGLGTLAIGSEYGNGITSKDDLCITGGAYDIVCGNHGIEANDSVAIAGGTFAIEAGKDGIHCASDEQEGFIYLADGTFRIAAGSDGIQATSYLVADGGEYRISASEGLEATYVQINGGSFSIQATDDGVNAAAKSPNYDIVIEINGGELTIAMGPGDTDGLDANGLIAVNGGVIDVSGGSTFDYDRGAVYTGGTIIVNGTTVDAIPEPTMGGDGGRGWNRGGRGGF